MRRPRIGSYLVLALLVLPFLVQAGEVKEAGDLLAKARVPLASAVDAALIAAPGSAVSARLVRGEDGPRWRVLVHRGEQISEVHVDAVTARATLVGSFRDESEAEKARGPRPGD
jgi:hypothetical protein